MPTRFIHRGADAAQRYTGNHCGIGVDSDDNVLYVNSDGTRRPVATSNVKIITASTTATTSQNGTTFIADSTTTCVVTLPATVAGLKYRLIVGQVTSANGHAFSPAAADKIIGNGFTAADDKDAICSAATDVEGDFLELTGDGSLGWYITGIKGTWARE